MWSETIQLGTKHHGHGLGQTELPKADSYTVEARPWARSNRAAQGRFIYCLKHQEQEQPQADGPA